MRSELQFFADTLIIETLLSDPRINKKAQASFVPSLVNKVKDYASSHIDSNNKVSSVLAILTPGILTVLGFPVLGFLVKLSEMVFHIDLSSIFSSIGTSVAELINDNKQTDSNSVINAVQSAIESNAGSEPTEEEANKFFNIKSSFTLREAQLFKIALADFAAKNSYFDFDNPKFNMKFAAGVMGSLLSAFGLSKFKLLKILASVISWIVRVVLWSAGFMVAGDAVHHMMGTSNSVSTKENIIHPVSTVSVPANHESITLKVNPNYSSESFNNALSTWMLPGNVSSIMETIISWATEIYPELKGFENLLKSTSGFHNLNKIIQEYNEGSNLGFVVMPKQFTSRKQVVDTFVSEIQNDVQNKLSNVATQHPGVSI